MLKVLLESLETIFLISFSINMTMFPKNHSKLTATLTLIAYWVFISMIKCSGTIMAQLTTFPLVTYISLSLPHLTWFDMVQTKTNLWFKNALAGGCAGCIYSSYGLDGKAFAFLWHVEFLWLQRMLEPPSIPTSKPL